MKRNSFFLTLCFVLNAAMCVAQETHAIEPAEFEITYSIKEPPFWDIYIFRCGKKASQYFCQAKLKKNIMLANDDPAYFILSNEEMKYLNTPEYEKKNIR